VSACAILMSSCFMMFSDRFVGMQARQAGAPPL